MPDAPRSAAPVRGRLPWRPLLGLVVVLAAGAVVAAVGSADTTSWLAGWARPTPFAGMGVVQVPDACDDIDTVAVGWHYTWETDGVCGDSGFVPMVWGDWCASDDDCAPAVDRLAASDPDLLLGFNEPESIEQSSIEVDRAVELWHHLDGRFRRLASPAVSNSDAGRQWLDRFMAEVDDRQLQVDVMAAHWYGDCRTPTDLLAHLTDLGRFGRPIWLTEFSCRGGDEETNVAFIEQLRDVLPAVGGLERVAWFTNRSFPDGWERTALVGDDGELTIVGEAYRGLPACVLVYDDLVVGRCPVSELAVASAP